MTDLYWKNVKNNLCLMCDTSLGSSSYYTCNKCSKICKVNFHTVSKEIMDVKSVCCNADIQSNNKITCGSKCHEKFVLKMIKKYGLYKKVMDQQTNTAYKIPTRLIIEDGVTQKELKNYPVWNSTNIEY